MGPCIVNIFQYISNKMQLHTVYLYLETALHVSGGMTTLTEVFPCFSSVVRQMPGWCPQRRGTARTPPNFLVALCTFCVALCIFFCVILCIFLCCPMWCLFCDVPCIVCLYMCTEQLPPGGYPIAVKYIISYIIFPPIIRSANNCTYSIWYLSHRYCYLPLSWRSYRPKQVEQFQDINKLCKVASCWIYILE
jgi:hypothetical protein